MASSLTQGCVLSECNFLCLLEGYYFFNYALRGASTLELAT